MTSEEYLERGWQSFLTGAGSMPHAGDCEVGFKDRFRADVEQQNRDHPRWLASEADNIAEKARLIGERAALLAGLSGTITVANVNKATYQISTESESPTNIC